MYQKLVIVGRLGRDPEMRYTPTGQAVTSFSVATDRQYSDQSGKPVKETVWFKVTAWGKLAETCNTYLQKGKLVLIEGRLTVDTKTGGPRVWTGQDGQARASYEVTAQTVKFLSQRQEGGEPGQEEELDIAPSEEIPF
ncbi:MAG TPA: single-stranded DNA-binding protein [Anaerolineaceae bacterium]|jgi:single-strand DNA-binding protein|nr:single-stranded DNA-binding protein [Chloroflexota bacterium]HNS07982.1 single-stranded DNA-binding protein [Anaerolineaceae bacterium]HOE01841.1 single-stranded DNA-binding protein [Anaerolineaceae bacterium]HOQ69874.1 single-stranded DNA-binding protein [Anaerolineaceae bacterium]HOS54190.1 single-stranded DNA-binding protein [Anaerolineaceae bacterium]